MLVLVVVMAITARTCAEKERQILTKRVAAPKTEPQSAARHPASPFQWTLDAHGLGPVKLGAAREVVEKAAGEPFRVGQTGREMCGIAEWAGAPAGVKVVMGAGVVRRIEVDANSGGLATEGGVKVGTDSQFVVNTFTALGKPILPSARSGTVIVNLTPNATPASALSISFLDHKVWSYQLGYLHEIDNGNVCS